MNALYDCECLPGYTNSNCDIEIDECLSMPCINGECKDELSSFSCTCFPGFYGITCGENFNECLSNPCRKGVCNEDPMKPVYTRVESSTPQHSYSTATAVDFLKQFSKYSTAVKKQLYSTTQHFTAVFTAVHSYCVEQY